MQRLKDLAHNDKPLHACNVAFISKKFLRVLVRDESPDQDTSSASSEEEEAFMDLKALTTQGELPQEFWQVTREKGGMMRLILSHGLQPDPKTGSLPEDWQPDGNSDLALCPQRL